jgi:hypothetical protein
MRMDTFKCSRSSSSRKKASKGGLEHGTPATRTRTRFKD